jgi:hypothetical protein
MVPLTVAFSILRYRLFDIDRLIHRTLVYSILTSLLGLIYFLGVVLLQDLFGDFSQSYTFVIVLSTLGIAALFTPLRLRVQALIDRVFYRRKYDIARTLSRFSSVLRSELDVDALSQAVIDVVEDTLHPEQAFIWFNAKPVGDRFRPVQRAQTPTK